LADAVGADLGEVPGIEAKSGYSFDLMPVAAALRYNTYFKSFILRNVPRQETVLRLADIMLRCARPYVIYLFCARSRENICILLSET
jgi:hypothetical protein